MEQFYRDKPGWLAVGLQVIFLGLIALLLLPFLAGQSARSSGIDPTSLLDASAVRPGNLAPPGLRSDAPDPETPGRRLVRPQVASLPVPGFHQNLAVLPAASIWRPTRCPLPPASIFSFQPNLRKYLETWPEPGSTATEAWPEYVPEDGEDVD